MRNFFLRSNTKFPFITGASILQTIVHRIVSGCEISKAKAYIDLHPEDLPVVQFQLPWSKLKLALPEFNVLCARTKQTKKIINNSVFQNITPFISVKVNRRLARIYYAHLQDRRSHICFVYSFDLEDRGDMSLRNISLPSPKLTNYIWYKELFLATVMRTCSRTKELFLLSYKPFSKWPPCSRSHNSALHEKETRKSLKVLGVIILLEFGSRFLFSYRMFSHIPWFSNIPTEKKSRIFKSCERVD
jgi:hypothetical protein